jgi:hypothetical protein
MRSPIERIPAASAPRIAAVVVVSLCLSLCRIGHAQSIEAESGAQSLFIDPSVRASAMGGSSGAVFWGDCPNYWSNPGLLGSRKGVVYEWGRTQLVPDLAENVFFTTKRLTIGGWGLGIMMAGKPVDKLGGLRLDYGESFATDPDGNILGTFTSYEDTQSLGGGANLLEFAEHALAAGGLETPAMSRFGDVGIGWSEKKTHVFLAPAGFTQDGTTSAGYVTTHDSGVLIRLTPYNSIDYAGLLPGLDRVAGARVDFSYGGSTQNYNHATIAYIDPSQSDPVARMQRKGWAAHLALDVPARTHSEAGSGTLGWVLGCVTPLLSVGSTHDRAVPLIWDAATGGYRAGERIKHSGWEVTIANIYSIRGGRVDDPAGTVHGHTSGWGIALHVKDAVGFSYDAATVPQSIYLDRVHRKAASFFIDPVRAWGLLRRPHRV